MRFFGSGQIWEIPESGKSGIFQSRHITPSPGRNFGPILEIPRKSPEISENDHFWEAQKRFLEPSGGVKSVFPPKRKLKVIFFRPNRKRSGKMQGTLLGRFRLFAVSRAQIDCSTDFPNFQISLRNLLRDSRPQRPFMPILSKKSEILGFFDPKNIFEFYMPKPVSKRSGSDPD